MKLTRRELMAMVTGVALPTPAPAATQPHPPKQYESDNFGIWQVTEITHYATRMDRGMVFQYTLEPVGMIDRGILHRVCGDHGYSPESGTLGWCMGYQFLITAGVGSIRYSRVGSMGLMRDLVRPWKGDLL